MSTVPAASNSSGTHELHPLRNQWWCFLLLGIALVILGALCIGQLNPLAGTHRDPPKRGSPL